MKKSPRPQRSSLRARVRTGDTHTPPAPTQTGNSIGAAITLPSSLRQHVKGKSPPARSSRQDQAPSYNTAPLQQQPDRSAGGSVGRGHIASSTGAYQPVLRGLLANDDLLELLPPPPRQTASSSQARPSLPRLARAPRSSVRAPPRAGAALHAQWF